MAGIYNATVIFLQNGVEIKSTQTGLDGTFSINIPAGTYVVNVVYPPETGYAEQFSSVVVSDPNPANNQNAFPVPGVDVVAGQPTTVTVYSNRVAVVGNQPPVASSSSKTNNRTEDHTVVLTLTMSDFPYTDVDADVANSLKITALPASGVLKYNGSAVTVNQEIALTAGAFSNSMTFESDQTNYASHNVTVQFMVRTANLSTYSNAAVLTITNTAFNSTTLYPYLSYSSSEIKARSVIPSSSLISDLTSSVVCYGLLPSQAKAAIGSGGNATWDDLFALAIGTGASGQINKWSYFSPTVWSITGGVASASKRNTSDKRSTFAGYNHAATAPYIYSSSPTFIPAVGNTGVEATLYLGEINWPTVSGIAKVGIQTYVGSTILGTTYHSISYPGTDGFISLSNNMTLNYTGAVTLTTRMFFANASNVELCDIPEIGTFTTTYSPPSQDFTFPSTAPNYQSTNIYVPSDEWTIVSKPAWIDLAVYRSGIQITGGNPYFSGDELRIIPSAVNTGTTRTGLIELSNGIEFNVTQQGAPPAAVFESQTGIVMSSTQATLQINATSIPFSFHIDSGLGSLFTDITVAVSKDGVGFMGSTIYTSSKDGQNVSGTITGIDPTAIGYGTNFTFHVETLV